VLEVLSAAAIGLGLRFGSGACSDRRSAARAVATAEGDAAAVSYCALDAPASMTGAVLDVNGASYLRT